VKSPLLLALCGILIGGCYKTESPTDPKPGALQTYGTGDYTFVWSPAQSDRPVAVFYHIPAKATTLSPVLLVFHGAGRDALPSRDALIAESEDKGFILLAPEFSNAVFPGSNEYNLGGVFSDGESPSSASRRPEERWTFSLIEPLFADAQNRFRFEASKFDAFGHSAGSQFLHRLLLFKPDLPIDRAVCNAAGWYTVPDAGIEYPYGMGTTGISSASFQGIFSESVRVSVGALDTDPNSFDLRHTPEADAQGNHRVERAQYFFQTSGQLAQQAGASYQWRLSVWPGVGHDFEASADFALNLLYP